MEATFGQDERVIAEFSVRTSVILFWKHAKFTLTDRRLVGTIPSALLGVIPLGSSDMTQPVRSIGNVLVRTKFKLLRFLIGVLVLLIGLSSDIVFGVLLVILGIALILVSFPALFIVSDNAGGRQEAEVDWLEKNRARAFAGQVANTIADFR